MTKLEEAINKYRERAHDLLLDYDLISGDESPEGNYFENVEGNAELVLEQMCKLAEEVHQEHVKLYEELCRAFDNHVSKEVVEIYLQQQRERCAAYATVIYSKIDDCILVDAYSILNAKLKID
jgi:hypothetical protein